MYKQASQFALRFTTPVGLLSVEQLWDLSQAHLSTSIKAVKKVLNKDDDDDLSFLSSTKVTDTVNQLRFDILKDVYLTKQKTLEDARNAAETKAAYNQKILTLIADKKEESLKNLPIEELEKLLKK